VAWNREQTGDPVVGFEALRWSVPAVRSATQRLAALSSSDASQSDLSPSDRKAALAAISDAVWTVTMVDAAMVRYHPDVYERVLDAESSADRRCIEQGLAGLRFVRNQIHDDAMLGSWSSRTTPGVPLVGWASWAGAGGLRQSRSGTRAAVVHQRGRRAGTGPTGRNWWATRSTRSSSERRHSSTAQLLRRK
jgi:hypothetical protein